MFTPLLRRLTAGVVAAGLALSLAACSSTTVNDPASTASGPAASADAFPVTIESALGSATIPSKPKRVVTIGWGSSDTVVALGTVPVGIEKVSFGNDSTDDYPWVTAAIKKMGGTLPKTFNVYPDIDVSAIAALDPDAIIAPQSGLTQAQFTTLNALAPTVAYPDKAWLTPWDTQITTIGKALGKTAESQKLVTDLKGTLAKTAAANPELSKLSFAYVSSATPGSLSIYQKGDPRVDIISGLGLTEDKTAAAVPLSAGAFSSTIGLEKADLLKNADIVISWYNDEANAKEVAAQPLFASIPAVKRGSFVSVTDQKLVMASSFITPLSVPYALDRYVDLLKTAAAKVG